MSKSKPIVDNDMIVEYAKACSKHAQLVLKKKRVGESFVNAVRRCDSFSEMMRDTYVCGPSDIFKDPERRRDFEDDSEILLEKVANAVRAYHEYANVFETEVKSWLHAVRLECEYNLKVNEHTKLDDEE